MLYEEIGPVQWTAALERTDFGLPMNLLLKLNGVVVHLYRVPAELRTAEPEPPSEYLINLAVLEWLSVIRNDLVR